MRNLGKLFLALCLLTVGGGIVANAQVDTQIVANVPFAFVVGDTTLPAGGYQIKTVDDADGNVLEIRSANSRTTVVFNTVQTEIRDDQTVSKTELVFNKVEGQYFLSQIWVAGTSSGDELTPSRKEKRLAKGGSQSEKQYVVASTKRLKS